MLWLHVGKSFCCAVTFCSPNAVYFSILNLIREQIILSSSQSLRILSNLAAAGAIQCTGRFDEVTHELLVFTRVIINLKSIEVNDLIIKVYFFEVSFKLFRSICYMFRWPNLVVMMAIDGLFYLFNCLFEFTECLVLINLERECGILPFFNHVINIMHYKFS